MQVKYLDAYDTFEMPWWVQFLWLLAFGSLAVIGVGGNIIVIWIILGHQEIKCTTNNFVINMGLSDIMLILLNCSVNSIYMVQGYLAIVYPLQPRITKWKSKTVLFGNWCFSFVIAIPSLLYSNTIKYNFTNTTRISCMMVWPDGYPTSSTYDFIYQVTYLLLTYAIPMVLMIFFYIQMGRVLWGSQMIGEQTERQSEAIQAKRRIVVMFIFILCSFAICWLPYHVYFIYTHFNRYIAYESYAHQMYLFFYWLAMANTMTNPLAYYWMNCRFRQHFHSVMCCCTAFLIQSQCEAQIKTPERPVHLNLNENLNEIVLNDLQETCAPNATQNNEEPQHARAELLETFL